MGRAAPSGSVRRRIRNQGSRCSGNRSPRQRYFAAVAKQLNSLDPYVHRMLYCYLRALRLRNEEFWEDSVTPLDAAVRIAAELVRNRLGNVTGNPYEAMISELSLRHANRACSLED